MDRSILFLIPNDRVERTIGRVLHRLGEKYPVLRTSADNALELAKTGIHDGAKVIISMGLTAYCLQRELELPVLEMIFSNTEFVQAIQEALTYSRKILIIGSGNVRHFAMQSVPLISARDVNIQFKEYDPSRSVREQACEFIDNTDCDVIISGTPAADYARSKGKRGILFDVDEKMVEFILFNAKALVRLERSREERSLVALAILNHSPEGMLLTDSTGKITALNHAAEQLVGVSQREALGRQARKLLEERNVVNLLDGESGLPSRPDSIYIVMNVVPIYAKEEYRGSLFSMRDAEEMHQMAQEAQKTLRVKGHTAKNTFSDIVGASEPIQRAKEKAKLFAAHDSTVLIFGETGTGKELFAQSIHNASQRRLQAFVAVNCAALPENLLESELFGYVKGAFTGARSEGKPGLFEQADLGTIFLDEISEFPLNMQARLLRVLQEKEVVRIGDDKVRSVDVRVVAASNQRLRQMVEEGKFRQDLYYRLCVLELRLPPLRERREDIPLLIDHLIRQKNLQLGKNITELEPRVLSSMLAMSWPGNVRQLDNFVENMMIVNHTNQIRYSQVGELFSMEQPQPGDSGALPLDTLENTERRLIRKALEHTHYNKAACARLLGIDTSTLWRKLKRMDIQ